MNLNIITELMVFDDQVPFHQYLYHHLNSQFAQQKSIQFMNHHQMTIYFMTIFLLYSYTLITVSSFLSNHLTKYLSIFKIIIINL